MKKGRIIICLLLAITFIASMAGYPAYAAGENWLPGWENRVKVTVDQTRVDANLTDFPVLINLSTSSGINSADLSALFNNLGSDTNRKKIAVTTADGITQCYVEIEKWNTASKQAVLWAKIPSVSGSVNTDLYLYFDKNQTDNSTFVGDKGSEAAKQVWDDNYKLILHLDDSRDSTQYGRDGAYENGTPEKAAGVGGSDSLYFHGPYLEIPSTNDFSVDTNGGQLLISFWFSPKVNPMTNGEYTHFISKHDGSGAVEWAFRYYNNVGRTSPPFNADNRRNAITFYYWNNDGGLGAGARWDRGPLPEDTWVYVTAAADYIGDRFYIYGWPSEYKEGKSTGSGGYWKFSGSPVIKPNNAGAPVRLGHCPGRPSANARIDEFRISNSLRTDAWVKADYYSQCDSLVTYGPIETTGATNPQPDTPPVVSTSAANNITANGATFNGNLTATGSSGTAAVSFDYGTTTSYGNSTAPQIRTTPGPFSVNIAGLSPNTTYYYRAKATGSPTVYGNSQAFTTANISQPPVEPPVERPVDPPVNPPVDPVDPPVAAEGTFGLDSGNNTYDQFANALQAMRYQNTAGDGTLTQLELLVDDTTPSGKGEMGVYADNNGRPGQLLLDAGEFELRNGWNSISNLDLPVSANSYYWLAFNLDSDNSIRYQSNQAARSHYRVNGLAYGNMPDTFPANSKTNANRYIMRATVTLD